MDYITKKQWESELHSDKPTLFIMCGIPGSGKSALAEDLAECLSITVHSSDKIREELGDVNDQSQNTDVFDILHKRVIEDLHDGKNTIFDATNLNRRRRIHFLNMLKKTPCNKVCLLIALPFEECMKRNNQRERNVPSKVMWRMYMNFETPSVMEGFDKIKIIYDENFGEQYYGNWSSFYDSTKNLSHDNHHHTLTIGEHCKKAFWYFLNKGIDDTATCASAYHDVGKPKTKVWQDSKGNTTEEAHFFQHHNVGSYDVLFYDCGDLDKLEVSLLINYHMRPFMAWKDSEKTKNRDRKFLGDRLFSMLEMLHEADLYAH